MEEAVERYFEGRPVTFRIQRVDDPHVRVVEQISANRWNHQVVLRTLEDARSDWLRRLLGTSYRLGSR